MCILICTQELCCVLSNYFRLTGSVATRADKNSVNFLDLIQNASVSGYESSFDRLVVFLRCAESEVYILVILCG